MVLPIEQKDVVIERVNQSPVAMTNLQTLTHATLQNVILI